jgi:hypothetical protein
MGIYTWEVKEFIFRLIESSFHLFFRSITWEIVVIRKWTTPKDTLLSVCCCYCFTPPYPLPPFYLPQLAWLLLLLPPCPTASYLTAHQNIYMDVIISRMKTRATKLCHKILSSLRVEVFRHGPTYIAKECKIKQHGTKQNATKAWCS